METFIHIYILISINELTDKLTGSIHINNVSLWSVILASISLIAIATISLLINLHGLKKVRKVLSVELTNSKKRLAGDNHSIKGRAIIHTIDTIVEPGNWLSLPTRLLIIIITLYSYNFSLIWPLISASIAILFSFALSKYQYNLAKATVGVIKSRSYIVRRFVRRQYLRTEWMKKATNRILKKELYIRNKGTFIEELSQQVPIITSLLFAIIVIQASIIPSNQAVVFIFSALLISSIISEVPAIIGLTNKTSAYFDLIIEGKGTSYRDKIWSGSLASNTLMHDCVDVCHDIFESIFGEGFLDKHKLEVDINALSTAQQNVILAIREAWDNKTPVIADKYLYSMDVNTKKILSNKLRHIFKNT